MTTNPLPRAVSQAEWQTKLGEHRAREKAATRARDALAVERRPTVGGDATTNTKTSKGA